MAGLGLLLTLAAFPMVAAVQHRAELRVAAAAGAVAQIDRCHLDLRRVVPVRGVFVNALPICRPSLIHKLCG